MPIHREVQVVEWMQYLIGALQELLKNTKVVPQERASEKEVKKSTAILRRRSWMFPCRSIQSRSSSGVCHFRRSLTTSLKVCEGFKVLPQQRVPKRTARVSVPQIIVKTVGTIRSVFSESYHELLSRSLSWCLRPRRKSWSQVSLCLQRVSMNELHSRFLSPWRLRPRRKSGLVFGLCLWSASKNKVLSSL